MKGDNNMNYTLTNATIFTENNFIKANITISNGIIVDISLSSPSDDSIVLDFNNYFIFPGFIDVHVHLREPGFFYKETISSGTMAAAHGGYTTVCSMPNLTPTPDCMENLNIQLNIIKNSAKINVIPYGTITKGEQGKELSDIDELAKYVAAFSDDGRGVQNEQIMKKAMFKIKEHNKILAAHCEDNSLLNGGYIHDGEYAKLHNHKGISSESEWKQIKRDLKLVKETGCKYHICHISTKESVELIRQAKSEGLDVSCETAPHYLVLNDMNLQEDGRFKMNPPIRSEADRLALIEGVCDGTIDMIATDHAPHSAEEKSRGLKGSAMGVVGLETAFPILYTNLVKTKIISLEKLIELMHTSPSKRFKIGTPLKVGKSADLTVFDLNEKYKINPDNFFSKGKSTPFSGNKVYGKCKMTMFKREILWQENITEK
jgi:dihydroorotase